MIRVLVAEGDAEVRRRIVALLRADPALDVVGEVAEGCEAVDATERLRPDAIVMDIQLPGVDGYEVTRRIMRVVPTPIIMISEHADDLERRAFEALAAGALVLVGKPRGTGPEAVQRERRLIATVKLMAEVKVVRRWGPRGAAEQTTRPRTPARRHGIHLVAIGASAGGPPTVAEILRGLPAGLACPILLVQHIADGFAEGLATWLDRTTPLTVCLAEHGAQVHPGMVYVAPDGTQMGITSDGRLALTNGGEIDGFRPSASYLLRSVADTYGAAAVGVLLTGMGRDGAAGLLELRRRGGVTIAQDKESSVVFGMPGEAIRLGAAEHVLPPKLIAEAIVDMVGASEPAGGLA